MKNLVYVGDSKGGVGKSLFSMVMTDYFRKSFPEDEILLVETDSSNPDVARLYDRTPGVSVDTQLLNEEEKGWITLVDTIDETKAKHVIINSMAASNLGVRAQWSLFEQQINSLNMHFNVFWIMNRNKDSVTLLRDFLSYVKVPTIYPVKNLYFGTQAEFLFYINSLDIQEAITERGGWSFDLPNLNDLIADKLYTEEINFESLPSKVSLGMRGSLHRWLQTVRKPLDRIYSPSPHFVNGEHQG